MHYINLIHSFVHTTPPLLCPVGLSRRMLSWCTWPKSSKILCRSASSMYRGIWPTNIFIVSGSGSDIDVWLFIVVVEIVGFGVEILVVFVEGFFCRGLLFLGTVCWSSLKLRFFSIYFQYFCCLKLRSLVFYWKDCILLL